MLTRWPRLAVTAAWVHSYIDVIKRATASNRFVIDELATAWKVAASAKDAAAATAQVTPIKGTSYEAEIHEMTTQIAIGLR